MPQALLPLVPAGATKINDRISVFRDDEEWTYFCGVVPMFHHSESDGRSFWMFTSQLLCQGVCRQSDIVRTFGVSANSVKRYVKKYREEGVGGFFQPRKGRGGTVMTKEVIVRAQELLSRGCSRGEVATQLRVAYETLRKAINDGRLHEPSDMKATNSLSASSNKSERSVADASTEMGVACTRPMERVMSAMGMLQGAPTRFEACRDVSLGGVICALPALMANGLFEHLPNTFPALDGYYTTPQVITLLAYMALCRIKTVEQLQYESPGELGKVMGLDRVPEVRCLRYKLAQLSQDDAPEKWAGLLSQQWLEDNPERAGTLYVDGHVRLYHGKLTELPKRYVSRQRLCLRGTTDYWVNDILGLPFFSVVRPIDHGMLEALRSDIVPRLLEEVPQQPTAEELEADPYRCRFVIIFDREGYSPVFFKEMWETHRIACITYHKHPKEQWAEEEFSDAEVSLPHGGEMVPMKLAERGSWIGSKADGLWVREVRKLCDSGHQVSLTSSAYGHAALEDTAGLFNRWSQENFFRYMMEHFAFDALSEHQTEQIPGTNRPVVNPRWRGLNSRLRSLKGKLQRRHAEFAEMTLHPEVEVDKVEKWELRKGELLGDIQQLEHEVGELKTQRKETPNHLEWDELEPGDKFEQLAPSRKRLMDTVKLIAYRAETAMMQIIRQVLSRNDDARSLVRDLLRSEVDLLPDTEANVLTIVVHSMANPRSNRAVEHLLDELNATESHYPGTQFRLVYRLVHS